MPQSFGLMWLFIYILVKTKITEEFQISVSQEQCKNLNRSDCREVTPGFPVQFYYRLS